MKYFIVENNKQSGPFSIYELKDKGITSETLVWAEGMTDWTPAWKVDELRAFLFNTKDASTPPPLPEDVEQPAATQAEPAAAIEKKKPQGSSCLKRMFVGFLFLLAVLLVAMAVSCPSEQAHKNKIKEKITLALEQSAQRNNNLFGVGIGLVRHLLTDEILDRVLDEMVDYHSYYVFSKCTINSDGKDKNMRQRHRPPNRGDREHRLGTEDAFRQEPGAGRGDRKGRKEHLAADGAADVVDEGELPFQFGAALGAADGRGRRNGRRVRGLHVRVGLDCARGGPETTGRPGRASSPFYHGTAPIQHGVGKCCRCGNIAFIFWPAGCRRPETAVEWSAQ